MKLIELLLGERIVWDNIVVVVPKIDYNPVGGQSVDDWEQLLLEKENEVNQIIYDCFKTKPLGTIAISQLLPKNINKGMVAECKKVLYEKYDILRNHAHNSRSFETINIEHILAPKSLYEIKEKYE